ncbi:MAG: hypothetical protein KAQ68_02480 [Clostridiales bacterium]|nr:hypothetical protein [Clostridiales bacterium]
MKKLLTMVLVICLVLTMFVACKTEETETKTTESKTTEKAAEATKEAPVEKYKLTYFGENTDALQENGYVESYFENLMPDCDFEWIEQAEDWKAQVNMLISAGESPDVWHNVSIADYDIYIEQGVIREIPLDLVSTNCPGYVEYLSNSLSTMDDPWTYVRRDEGKVYGMLQLWSLGPYSRGLGIRQDWLINVGITKTPETLEEYEAAMKAFSMDDPDGNGENDTYGLTGYINTTNDDILESFTFVFGAFGVTPNTFIANDAGQIVRGEVEPGAKEALTVLNRWYTEGYIDPEFMINQRENMREKVLNEKTGSLISYWWSFFPAQAFYSGYFVENMKETDAEWTTIVPPSGSNGDKGVMQRNPAGDSLVFGSHVDDALLGKYLESIQLGAFSFEGIEAITKGEEGITFTKNADGTYEWIEPYSDQTKLDEYGVSKEIYNIGGCFNDYNLQMPLMTSPEYIDMRVEAEGKNMGHFDELQPIARPLFTENKDRLNQMSTKAFIDFITGNRSLDEFDDFVQEWYDLGGKEVMEEAQQAYDDLNN